MTVTDKIDRSLKPKLYPLPRFEYSYPDDHPWPKIYKYKLALIPMKLPLDCFEEHDGLLKVKENYASIVKDMILEISKKALDLEAKIIVFTEFSYPITEHENLNLNLIGLCQNSEAFIIAGTFHEIREYDSKYRFSKCPIYFTKGNIVYQYKNEPGCICQRWENIETPHLRTLQVIQSRYGIFSIPVCIDFLDSNLHHNLKTLNKRGSLYHPIDFMIIPSYTDEPQQFYKLAEGISAECNMCIIYVNNFIDGVGPGMFIGGSKVTGIEVPTLRDNYPNIYLYDMDLIKIREQRLFGENVDISEA